MAYNTSPTLDKQTCTDYVDYIKFQDRFGRFSWTKNDSNYLDLKTKVFKRQNKNAKIRLRQNFTKGQAEFNQFIRQRNQVVVAADNFRREQSLSPVSQCTVSKDMEEQLNFVLKVINVVDRPNRRICVTLLRYLVDNPETSYAKIRFFGRKKEEENIQQTVYVNCKLVELLSFLDIMNSEFGASLTNC